MGDNSLSLNLLPPCRVRQSASEEEGRRSTKDRFVVTLFVWDSSWLVHSNMEKNTRMHTLTHIYTHWNSRLSTPISPRTLHSITANPELQNRVQTSKRKSQNLRAQCAVANFLPSWISASEHSAGLLQNIHTAVLVHTDGGRTHAGHTTTKQLSVTQLSLLRCSERAAVKL